MKMTYTWNADCFYHTSYIRRILQQLRGGFYNIGMLFHSESNQSHYIISRFIPVHARRIIRIYTLFAALTGHVNQLDLKNPRPEFARDIDSILMFIIGDTVHDIYATVWNGCENTRHIDPSHDFPRLR